MIIIGLSLSQCKIQQQFFSENIIYQSDACQPAPASVVEHLWVFSSNEGHHLEELTGTEEERSPHLLGPGVKYGPIEAFRVLRDPERSILTRRCPSVAVVLGVIKIEGDLWTMCRGFKAVGSVENKACWPHPVFKLLIFLLLNDLSSVLLVLFRLIDHSCEYQ